VGEGPGLCDLPQRKGLTLAALAPGQASARALRAHFDWAHSGSCPHVHTARLSRGSQILGPRPLTRGLPAPPSSHLALGNGWLPASCNRPVLDPLCPLHMLTYTPDDDLAAGLATPDPIATGGWKGRRWGLRPQTPARGPRPWTALTRHRSPPNLPRVGPGAGGSGARP
jgi:hypothetical protein